MTCGEGVEPVLEWTAGAVASHLGVAGSTLRSWSRRYGLGPSGHAAGRHRRFGTEDIARLETMSRLVSDGVAPAAAARWVRDRSLAELDRPSAIALARPGPDVCPVPDGIPGPPETIRSGAALAGSRVEMVPGDVVPVEGVLVEGVPVEEVPVDRPAVAALLGAAIRLDTDAVAAALARHLERLGVPAAWEAVCLPSVSELGARVQRGVDCMDAEHLLAWSVTAALCGVSPSSRSTGFRSAVLACAAGEHHTLGLDALRAALAEQGRPVRMLGAATPASAVLDAVRRTSPGAVVVWAQSPRTARPSGLSSLGRPPGEPDRPRGGPGSCAVVAAGAGWDGRRLPPGTLRPNSLRAALAVVLAATDRAPTDG